MKVQVSGQYVNGNFVLAGTNGCAEIECDINDITALSDEKIYRNIGIGKNLYRCTLKSYKAVKKEFAKKGILYRFNNGKRN